MEQYRYALLFYEASASGSYNVDRFMTQMLAIGSFVERKQWVRADVRFAIGESSEFAQADVVLVENLPGGLERALKCFLSSAGKPDNLGLPNKPYANQTTLMLKAAIAEGPWYGDMVDQLNQRVRSPNNFSRN